MITLPLLTACATVAQPADSSVAVKNREDDLSWARLGETVAAGGPKVTSITVLEDSRCPEEKRCIWAGRVRVNARIDLGSGSQMRELTQGQPVPVADGTLELVEVQPKKTERVIASEAYRFGWRFMGGL